MKTITKASLTCSRCPAQGTYVMQLVCSNCGWRGEGTLTRGHAFSPYDHRCPVCGCLSLMRSREDARRVA